MIQEEIDKQWPGFTVTCRKCGSTRIELDDSRGWSPESGGWGGVDLTCLDCRNYVELVES